MHIEKKATPKIYPVRMSKEIKTRIPYGRTLEFSHVATSVGPTLFESVNTCYQ